MTDSHAASSSFIGGKSRQAIVTLDWPVEFAGTTYTAIGLRRMTAGEVAAFTERAREILKADPDANPRAPIFVGEDGASVPDGLFDALDDDDALRLDEAAADFLPRRFQAVRGEIASPPTDGSDTGPKS